MVITCLMISLCVWPLSSINDGQTCSDGLWLLSWGDSIEVIGVTELENWVENEGQGLKTSYA